MLVKVIPILNKTLKNHVIDKALFFHQLENPVYSSTMLRLRNPAIYVDNSINDSSQKITGNIKLMSH